MFRVPPALTIGVELRRLFARRPWLYWLPVVSFAVATGAGVLGHVERLERAERAWGVTTRAFVAEADTAPGDPIAGSWRDLPVAVVPPSAIIAEPVGVARQRLAAGAIVTEVDVTAAAGPLALVPDGWLAVAVVESPGSGAAVGEHVRVASEGVVIGDEALVVGSHDGATLIALPAEVAALVPLAADSGHLALLRVP